MKILLRTLTPLWTGGVDQTCDRLHETGLIGSLRWWYEALVRGLGGYACDPTSEDRCEYDPKKEKPPEKQLCAACYLFGCTGWARKFRLRVLDARSQVIQDALEKYTDFSLEFVELRPMANEEKWLLVKAVEIAAKYGALGGKTTLKPQKDQRKGADNGIVQWRQVQPQITKPNITDYLRHTDFRGGSAKLPDLRWFFFVKGTFLWRYQMNPLLGLDAKGKPLPNADEGQKFLQGERGGADKPAVSKKLFSFRADGGRIWGYAQDAQMRDKIVKEIQKNLGEAKYTVKTGEEVLHAL